MIEPRRRRPWRWAVPAAILLLGAGAYLAWTRAGGPAPPAVDLARADPAVAAAVRGALEAVRSRPRDPAAWGELGMVLRANDFDRESVAAFAAAEQFDAADWRWPYLQGLTLVLFEPARGEDCLKRAVDRAPADRTEPKLRLADVAFERGELDRAEQLTRGLSEPRAAILAARIAAERGDWNAVLAKTEPHRDCDACRKRAAAMRSEALRRLNAPDRADAEWSRAEALPDDPAWPDRAVEEVLRRAAGKSNRLRSAGELLAAGRIAPAIEALRGVIRDDPTDRDARLMLGQTLVRIDDAAGAERALRELTDRDPESVEGWFQLGVAQFLKGETAASLASFDRAILLKPDHLLAHFNRGHCQRKLGDNRAALAAFEAALRCKPDHAPSLDAIRAIRAGEK